MVHYLPILVKRISINQGPLVDGPLLGRAIESNDHFEHFRPFAVACACVRSEPVGL